MMNPLTPTSKRQNSKDPSDRHTIRPLKKSKLSPEASKNRPHNPTENSQLKAPSTEIAPRSKTVPKGPKAQKAPKAPKTPKNSQPPCTSPKTATANQIANPLPVAPQPPRALFQLHNFPPWVKGPYNQPSSLHHEILDFVEFISPTNQEKLNREELIQSLCKVVKNLWSKAEVEVFGSSKTDLYLPTSDIDCVVLGETDQLPAALYTLSLKLTEISDPDQVQVLSNAKVPIVKCVSKKFDIPIDIGFHQTSGVSNTAIVTKLLSEYPPLRPLVIVLKYFLKTRGLHEPYSGGIGSYGLILMVTSFLQTWNKTNETPTDYGLLLVEFLALFGKHFNYTTHGISVLQNSYFQKTEKGWLDPNRTFLLSIEDPNDPTNDVGRSSFRIMDVRLAFGFAYSVLAWNPNCNGSSALARVFPTEDQLVHRQLIKKHER